MFIFITPNEVSDPFCLYLALAGRGAGNGAVKLSISHHADDQSKIRRAKEGTFRA